MGWKIYFFILVGLLTAMYVLTFSTCAAAVYHYADILITLVTLIGIYGYAFRKPLVSRNFWKLWFGFFLLWDFLFNFVLPGWYWGELFDRLVLVAFLAMLIPAYLALYLYSFRSDTLWLRKNLPSASNE
jgi:hypothetical protein